MEILSFGVQAPGLDPGVGEMFRFVGPTPGNRTLSFRIAFPTSQICKEFPLACNLARGYIAVGPAKVPTPKALTFYEGWGGTPISIHPCTTLS